MGKTRYHVVKFPSCDWKNALAQLSEHVLEKAEHCHEILQTFTRGSHVPSPQRILHYMTVRSNENIFDLGVSRLCLSCEVQSGPESSSPVKGESISPSLFGATKDVSGPANLETKGSSKVDVNVMEESEENLHDLMKRNLVEITSMSITKQLEGVEVDIDMIYNLSESSPEKLGQDPCASEIANSPDKSPYSIPSKLGESTHGPSIPSEAIVDFLNRETLQLMSKGLSKISWYRKTCMERTYNCFLESRADARNFYDTICNIRFVVKYFPIENEKYFSQDLVKMRRNLMKKADEILKKVDPMVQELDENVNVWAECVKRIDDFEEKSGQPLSENSEEVLENLELMLKKIRSTVIRGDERKPILLKSSSDFEWLVKHFVKFLIITGILTPLLKT